MINLLQELQQLQNEVIHLVQSVSEENFLLQFHPDLSPIGWHLGHCIYTESYWVREQLLNQTASDDSLKSLYVPELSEKSSRSAALPNKSDLVTWAVTNQKENLKLLNSEIIKKNDNPLLEKYFLIYFLIQHYSQHIETMTMVITEMQLKRGSIIRDDIKFLTAQKPVANTEKIELGRYTIGSKLNHSYDNEKPAQTINLESFSISRYPASNSEYLQFILDECYTKKSYWSDEGWNWALNSNVQHPYHWRSDDDGNYYAIDENGAYSLKENVAVHGLSYYEAEAFANWCGARLPHEYEWEVAATKNVLQQSARVWEWCHSTLHPYPAFTAYPYEGYSVPYFDEQHYVLKGGSRYTKDWIKRNSFRNYYTADKRHIFAGLRLVYD